MHFLETKIISTQKPKILNPITAGKRKPTIHPFARYEERTNESQLHKT